MRMRKTCADQKTYRALDTIQVALVDPFSPVHPFLFPISSPSTTYQTEFVKFDSAYADWIGCDRLLVLQAVRLRNDP